jgi:hypothetical protein
MNATAAKTARVVEYQQLGIDESDALFLDYYEHQFAYRIEVERELDEVDEKASD